MLSIRRLGRMGDTFLSASACRVASRNTRQPPRLSPPPDESMTRRAPCGVESLT